MNRLLLTTSFTFLLAACGGGSSGSSSDNADTGGSSSGPDNGSESVDKLSWYIDADKDGFGDSSAQAVLAETDPSDESTIYLSNNSDCDDSNGEINPDATEINTDATDHNCDGKVSLPPYQVGDFGEAGGIVYFIGDDRIGYEATLGNIASEGSLVQWGCYEVAIDKVGDPEEVGKGNGAKLDMIGAGRQNTDDILAANCQPTQPEHLIAAEVANQHSQNGFDDWFLPSYESLDIMLDVYQRRSQLNNQFLYQLLDVKAFSSTASGDNRFKFVKFEDRARYALSGRGANMSVIAVRSFKNLSLEERSSWYLDADKDGFGDSSAEPIMSSNDPSDDTNTYLNDHSDCDDSNADINPDGSEVNSDARDFNCDGKISQAPYAFGDYGPAGGIIVVASTISDFYLEASIGKINSDEVEVEWGCPNIDVTGTHDSGLGRGEGSTNSILAADCAREPREGRVNAAELVNEYSQNGFDDWFLPSINELNAIFDLYKDRDNQANTDIIKYEGVSALSSTTYPHNLGVVPFVRFDDDFGSGAANRTSGFDVVAVRSFELGFSLPPR